MMSKKKLIIIIFIVCVIVVGLFVFLNYHQGKGSYRGKHNILVLCVDSTEQRQGIGAVDMAFILKLVNGNLYENIPVYPGGMYDSSLNPPEDLRSQGVNKWYLHDSLWTSDLSDGAKRAQKIVKTNTNLSSDIVVIVTPEAIDAMINSVGPVYSNGNRVTSDSLDFLRSDQKDNGASRGDAIENLVEGIMDAAKNNGKEMNLFTTIVDQTGKGNIQFVPENSFQRLISYVGINKINPLKGFKSPFPQ